MPLDGTNLQIAITAKDMTGGAFTSMQRNLKQMEGSLASIQKGFAGFQTFIGRVQAGAAAFGLSLGVGQLVAYNQHILETVGGLGELAQQLGISTTALQAYQTAALQSGVKQAQLEQSLIKFNTTLGNAAERNKDAIEAFSNIGVKILDFNGKLRSSDDILAEVARRIMAMGSEAEKTAALVAIFGRSGARLLPLLPELAKGLAALTAEARAAGTVIEKDVIDKLDKAADRGALLHKRFQTTFARDVTSPFVDAMNEVLDYFNRLTERSGSMGIAFAQAFAQLIPLPGFQAPMLAQHLTAPSPGGAIGSEFGRRIGRGFSLPAAPASLGGASNPTPKGDADKFGQQMRSLADDAARFQERLAMLKSDSKTPWPELEKQLDSIERTEKRISDLTKGMPKMSPMAVMLATDAIAAEKARLALEKYEDAVRDADRFERQYGDGTLELQETLSRLDQAQRTGRLSWEAYTVAVQQAHEAQERQRDMMIGLADNGWGGFVAGMRIAMSEWDKANSAFSQGQAFFNRTMQGMEEALTQFVTTGKISFRSLANSIISDLIRMQIRAATTSLFGGGGLGGLLGSALGLGSTSSSGFHPFAGDRTGGFAGGGRPPLGRASWVGEQGPELFVPDSAGTIIPNHALGGMGGITINQSYVVSGGDEGAVDRAMQRWMPVMRKQALDAVLDARVRGGAFSQAFRQ